MLDLQISATPPGVNKWISHKRFQQQQQSTAAHTFSSDSVVQRGIRSLILLLYPSPSTHYTSAYFCSLLPPLFRCPRIKLLQA